jgi:hypothetical protein
VARLELTDDVCIAADVRARVLAGVDGADAGSFVGGSKPLPRLDAGDCVAV